MATEESPEAQFYPPHSDSGIDSDSNGKFELLRLSVNVLYTGVNPVDYYLQIVVYRQSNSTGGGDPDLMSTTFVRGATGEILGTAVQGVSTWDVDLDTTWLANCNVSGTWNALLVLVNEASGEVVDSDEYVTSSYSASAWEPSPAHLAVPFSDWGRDTNGDGKTDWLTVNITYSIGVAGYYSIAGFLYNHSKTALMTNDSTPLSFQETGTYTAQLDFNTTGFWSYEGPYYVVAEILDDWPVAATHTYHIAAYDTTTSSLG